MVGGKAEDHPFPHLIFLFVVGTQDILNHDCSWRGDRLSYLLTCITSYAYNPTSGYGPLSGGSIFNLGGYMKASTVYNNKAFSSEQLF